jgi:hypothetical protein
LEAFAAARQNAGDGRTIRRHGLAHMARQKPDRGLGGRLLDSAHFLASNAGPIDPKRPVRIGHDLHDIRLGQRIGDQRPQCVIEAFLLSVVNRMCICRHN